MRGFLYSEYNIKRVFVKPLQQWIRIKNGRMDLLVEIISLESPLIQ